MRNLIVVAFLEPVTEGLEFPRDDWPLHVTLAKFEVVGHAGAPASVPDALAERIAGLMAAPVAAALGTRLAAGGEAGFGRSGLIPVRLIEPSEPLQALHESLVRMVAALPGRITAPAYALAGYRPHVSHRGDRRVRDGQVVVLDRIALVDMAPDGGHATRRVLKLWTLPAA
ncbi:2'-5' RNA ligase family protein [Arthrobacter sp. UYEF20]|uniref:2'-5' RNA ligase family protein n=1 Tax=Arthrobacter sp. UYEF20 TaxID=1756363 RepID=UPI0033961F11